MKRYLIFIAILLVVLATYSIVGLQVVPSAQGTYAEVREKLEGAGFKVITLDASGETRESHDLEVVVGQSPRAGSVRPFGSIVTLTTRPPQQQIVVPDVVGMQLRQALDSLEQAGLAVDADEPTSLDATVASTIPAAGTHVPFGSAVFCRIGR